MTIYNFELLNVPFANTAVASEIAPFPDYNRGFGIAFDQTDGKPEMKGFNGLLKMVTTSVIYLKQRGISEWDSTFEYVAGKSFVVDGDKLYQAKTTNTNKQPSLSQNDWLLRASISDIKVSTNGNLKRTENQDGAITLEVPTASTDQRGAVRQATSTEVANRSNVNAYINPANALAIAQSTGLGVGQTRKKDTLVLNTTYTNTSSKPWFVSMTVKNTSSGRSAFLQLKVDGKEVAVSQDVATSYNSGSNVYVAYVTIEQIILPGESFIFENSSLGSFHCSSEIS